MVVGGFVDGGFGVWFVGGVLWVLLGVVRLVLWGGLQFRFVWLW